MLYKQHVIDEYYEHRARPVREAIGFYWAVRTRDHIQDIAKSFISSLDVIQDINPETGDFHDVEKDDISICSQDFMDYMDVAMFNAINDCGAREMEKEAYAQDLSTRELQKLTWDLLDNDAKKFKKLSVEQKKNYIRQCLWNYDDFKESFQFSLKKFTNEMIQKFMVIDYSDDDYDSVEEPEEFKCTVKDIYEIITKFAEINKGMPTKRDDSEEHSEESLDLISGAMFASEYIDFVVDYIVDEVK